MTAQRHLVVVEAYDGMLEFLSAEPEERGAARGLGLPLAAIAERLHCRVTLLTWDEWLTYETVPGALFEWMPFPAARALAAPGPAPHAPFVGERVVVRPIPATDPGHGRPLAASQPSPLTFGLLAESDPLFLLSYCLGEFLDRLHAQDPFHAVIAPMWGGAGYTAQMARATGASALEGVSFIVVVTDTSARRHEVNGEGSWTRPAITRRQMEDVSLALADHVLVFGPQGERLAAEGRLASAPRPVPAPRHVPDALLDRLAAAAARSSTAQRVQLFLNEPQDPASGVLAALDAAADLARRHINLDQPIVSAGPDTRFAPMKPQSFTRYWAERGFVKELQRAGCWSRRSHYDPQAGTLPVRLYPSAFEHLPAVWSELGRGSAVLLSAAAAEGLGPGLALPAEAQLGEQPDPAGLARAIEASVTAGPGRLDEMRRALCDAVVAAHRGRIAQVATDAMLVVLDSVLARPCAPQPLGRAAALFLDRKTPLARLSLAAVPTAQRHREADSTRLSVVVVCHNMGSLITETVESVWRSDRLPDELLLVDDGSDDATTEACLEALERAAVDRRLPLRLLRQPNRGLAAARNAGLAAATGDCISFLDGDDLIEPSFYRLTLEVLRRNPELGGVAAWALCFGAGVPDGFWNAPQPELPLLLVENTVIVPCMMRVATLRELGGYDTTLRYNYEDWELAVRLLASGRPIVTIPRFLQRYRTRAESLYRTMTDVQNQSMREQMLARHRETVARFAIEVALQIEHRLMKRLHTPSSRSASPRSRRIGAAVRAALATLRRRPAEGPGSAKRSGP
jgi:hypothetical protein